MFNETQNDILKEIINIGIGEAAFSLSEMVKSTVSITIPSIEILSSPDLMDYMKSQEKLLGVHISQNFWGKIKGKALLAYSDEASRSLLNVITGQKRLNLTLSDEDTAILQEIGNIIMGSCISNISNIIDEDFRFEMPHVMHNGHTKYFNSLVEELLEFDNAVVAKTKMTVKKINIEGYIFILLGLDELLSIINKLEKKMK